MNRTTEHKTVDIEARLERSLLSQVRAPKLDGRFDAAIWARIETEKNSAAAPAVPRKSAASRWILASNIAGALITVTLVCAFGSQAFTGIEVDASLPQVSSGLVERAIVMMTWPVTIVALASGLMLTSFGRRLRSEFF